MEAYNCGQRDFGENRAQELTTKHALLPKDIRWHFIGHLQRNKVKLVVPVAYLIQSVDTADLLGEINGRAGKAGIRVNCLLQVSIADEESKYGFTGEDTLKLAAGFSENFPNICLRGMMGMATLTDNIDKVKSEFRTLANFFKAFRLQFNSEDFNILSMGMTGDYPAAIGEGSNMVRIGSLIFGDRH